MLSEAAPDLADACATRCCTGSLHGFPGQLGSVRESAGPGWALVGDAGYFKDPLTAHGITDALLDADYLARAVAEGGDAALRGYEAARDARR